MALPGSGSSRIGIRFTITFANAADTAVVERKKGAGAYAEIGQYLGKTGPKTVEDLLPNDGATYSYRALARRSGFADSGYSAVISDIPRDLDVA